MPATWCSAKAGQLSDQDIAFLTFRSGYTNFATCLAGQTVGSCDAFMNNGVIDPSTVGFFDYGGGHMQKHATLIGLGALDNAGLAAEVQAQLGSDIVLSYAQPQPAGGVVTTADSYARFLRKLLSGSLQRCKQDAVRHRGAPRHHRWCGLRLCAMRTADPQGLGHGRGAVALTRRRGSDPGVHGKNASALSHEHPQQALEPRRARGRDRGQRRWTTHAAVGHAAEAAGTEERRLGDGAHGGTPGGLWSLIRE